jgi:hypothetical protein
MLKRRQVQDAGLELDPRYGAGVVRETLVLAARLQVEFQERFSAAEIEAIGAEVGIEPVFIRQALATVAAEESSTGREERRAGGSLLPWERIVLTLCCAIAVSLLLHSWASRPLRPPMPASAAALAAPTASLEMEQVRGPLTIQNAAGSPWPVGGARDLPSVYTISLRKDRLYRASFSFTPGGREKSIVLFRNTGPPAVGTGAGWRSANSCRSHNQGDQLQQFLGPGGGELAVTMWHKKGPPDQRPPWNSWFQSRGRPAVRTYVQEGVHFAVFDFDEGAGGAARLVLESFPIDGRDLTQWSRQ